MLSQWHVKDPGHSARSAGVRLHLNTYTPLPRRSRKWADYAAVQAWCARNMSGNIRPQSSEFAEPLWDDPGLKSGISVRELISTSGEKRCKGGE